MVYFPENIASGLSYQVIGMRKSLPVVQSSKTNSYSEELRDTSVWVDYQVINSEIQSNLL